MYLEPSIFNCVQDSSRTMWFASFSGLVRYTPKTGNWKWYRFKQAENNLLNQITGLLCDRRGTLWAGTQGGLLRYDKAKDSFLLAFPKLPREPVTGLSEGADGRIWFALSTNILATYQPETGTLMTGVPKGCENGFFMHRILGTGNIWISPLSGANKIMEAPRSVVLDTLRNEFMMSRSPLSLSPELLHGIDLYPLATDESGGWYVRVQDYAASRCESGLYRIVPQGEEVSIPPQKLLTSFFNEQFFRGTISAFCRDPRTGIVCVGVSGQGLTVLIPTGIQRIGDHRNIGDIINLHSDRLGRTWYGTYRGLFLRVNEGFVAIPFAKVPNATPQQANIPVYDIQETSTGTILVSSIEGVFRYDEVKKILRPFQTLTKFIGKTTIRNIQPDPMSREFWVNVPSLGVVRCREDGSPLGYFPFGQPTDADDKKEALGTSNIFAMRFDSTGNLWLGGMGVLLRWQRQSHKLERLTTLPNKELALQPMRFIQPSKNSLITALFGIGIGCINSLVPSLNESAVEHCISLAPINNQLHDVQLNGIAAEGNTLWWTTRTNGIYRAKFTNPKIDASEFVVKKPELLLPADNNSVIKNNNDDLNKLTERGANIGAITPDGAGGVIFDYYGDVLRADSRARVFTDTARVVPIGYFRNDSAVAGVPLEGDAVQCSYNGSFALSLAVVSLVRPERHRLEYRLEGVDAVWNVMPDANLRTVRYSSLQPGEYRLLIRTSAQEPWDDAPLYSANTYTITITVPYPWWMHPLTRTVGFLALAAGFVWVGYTVQHRRNERRLLELEREKQMEILRRESAEAQTLIVKLQMQTLDLHLHTLRLQMNPHFMYNILAEIQRLVQVGNSDLANHYIGVFGKLLRHIVRQGGKEYITVSDEMSILRQYMDLEELRNDGRLKCYLTLNADVPESEDDEDTPDYDNPEITYWQEREVPTFILQPFVENAIRHGIRGLEESDWQTRQIGIVSVSVTEGHGTLRCVVEDNGVGRTEAARRKAGRKPQEHLSVATAITEKRMGLMASTYGQEFPVEYNDLYDEDGRGAGTVVTVVLPCRLKQEEPKS